MINFSIELGDGDVAVGVTKLNIAEKEFQYGLSFRDLVHPEEIGKNIKEQQTNNFIAITIKNKEALEVLKQAVILLERVMDGEDVEGLRDSLEGINVTDLVRAQLEKELKEDK